MFMKRLLFSLSLLLIYLGVVAADAVNWTIALVDDNTDHPALKITAKVNPGYHLYSVDNPAGGSMPLKFYFDTKGCKIVGQPAANKNYTKEYDDIFEVEQHFYDGTVVFTQKLKPSDKNYSVNVEIQGQACNDTGCVQVGTAKLIKGTFTGATEDSANEKKEDSEDVNALVEMTDSLQASEPFMTPEANLSGVNADQSWWDNVEAELRVFEDAPEQQGRSLLYIFIAGFLGGLIALVTPCVWPMIPMTVSFFLKQNKSKSKSVGTAAIYGASIIVIYVALGIIVTVLFGASALNELATSAVFNIIFFLLLVVFAISFMGGFELTLPSSWTNKMDSKVDTTTGLLSVFFMAFTLVLVSFSCTGPIIGTLLVEAAATSNFISPAIGMFGFALALALPFTLFAMFPTMLKAMPKSGGWMNTVKVVLGFLELALALKFLSVADLAYGWRILDREVFVSRWIVIFFLLGGYLLGKLRFQHD
ncbi:MAG: thiol:disulfide interchange protein, partial [Muribaculaceae bacterium]|nr:thiol:disulfide interchange protein [Muribaculaceae bacterium]